MSDIVKRENYCHNCGAMRGAEPFRDRFSLGHDIISIGNYKKLDRHPGRSYEVWPGLIYSLQIWRNGSGTHICNDCIRIGLTFIRDSINELYDNPPALVEKFDYDSKNFAQIPKAKL